VTLKSAKPPPYPAEPKTLGEHLKKRRHEFGLFQKQVAALLEVNEWTYLLWEQDRTTPMIRMWPRVIKFLGYYPFREPQSLTERLLAARRHRGICHRKAASMLSVDEGSYRYWEQGKRRPSQDLLHRIEAFVATTPESTARTGFAALKRGRLGPAQRQMAD